MEPTLLTRIIQFIRQLHKEYAAQSTAGLLLGGGLGFINYFGNIPDVLIHTWIGVWLWGKTIFWAVTSSIATSIGSKLVDQWWEKRQKKAPSTKKKKRAA